jgi:hypothetical protein
MDQRALARRRRLRPATAFVGGVCVLGIGSCTASESRPGIGRRGSRSPVFPPLPFPRLPRPHLRPGGGGGTSSLGLADGHGGSGARPGSRDANRRRPNLPSHRRTAPIQVSLERPSPIATVSRMQGDAPSGTARRYRNRPKAAAGANQGRAAAWRELPLPIPLPWLGYVVVFSLGGGLRTIGDGMRVLGPLVDRRFRVDRCRWDPRCC